MINKVCFQCKEKFTTKEERRKFCTQKCYGNWRSENIKGEEHPRWTATPISYDYKHRRVTKLYPKKELCENCNKVVPVDLANISGEYKMDLSDWKWLCRRCHMEEDGRNDTLRKYGHASKKYPTPTCINCSKEFPRRNKYDKFCTKKCMLDWRLNEAQL